MSSIDNSAIGTVARRGGLTPSGLAISFTPLLTLLTSNRLGALEVAVLQIFTIFLVQFLSVFSKTQKEANNRMEEVPVSSSISRTGRVEEKPALEPQPVKVELVNGDPSELQERNAQETTRTSRRKKANEPGSVRIDESSSETPTEEVAEVPTILESTIKSTIDHLAEPPVRRIPSRAIQEHPLYSNESIDSCLRHFLAILDAPQLRHLPAGAAEVPAALPLSSWEQLLHTSSSRVCKHPSIPHLYAVRCIGLVEVRKCY